MKKRLLLSMALTATIATTAVAQTRYLDEVFTDVDVTSNVQYGSNITVITGSPAMQNLVMDVYEPSGDTQTDRPLIVFLHTGSFLPRYINQLATGDKTDSATVEMCTRFAKQGYVVANIAYRVGWNPQGDQDTRTGTILNAVYRGLQDAKTAVRFFRKDVATNSNSYGIDASKIAVGGQGSGGYISLAYGSVDTYDEIFMPKFYNFTSSTYYVDTSLSGGYDGLEDRPLNIANHVGYSSDVNVTFNIGGAIGDSTWIDRGDIPTISIQGEADAFAPYAYGIVNVPGTSFFVVDVSGASDVAKAQNGYNNNDIFKSPAFTDPITMAANDDHIALDGTYGNAGDEGLFTFRGAGDGNGPWEFFDEATAGAGATAYGQDSATIVNNTYASNPYYQALGPVAGKSRAMTFIDTIQGYVSPRLYRVFYGTSVDIQEDVAGKVSVYPNPANEVITFNSESNNAILGIELYTTSGRLVRKEAVNAESITLTDLNLSTGFYIAEIKLAKGTVTKKLMIK